MKPSNSASPSEFPHEMTDEEDKEITQEEAEFDPKSSQSDFTYSSSSIESYDKSLAQNRIKSLFSVANLPIIAIAVITFLNGLLGVAEPLFQRLAKHPRLFDFVVPYGFYHFSRALSLLFGFILIYLSFNLAARKRMSFILASFGLTVSLVVHVLRARMEYLQDSDFYSESIGFAIFPVLLNLFLLLIYRKRFVVKSEIRKIRTGLSFLFYSLILALAYGTLGFWLLDKKDFGINFQFSDALLRTLREFLLIGNADIEAQTRHAAWFMDSLKTMGTVSAVFACYSLFRPIEYQLRTRPLERAKAKEILELEGRDALDYYKLLDDKSFVFSASGKSFVAYRTALSVAVGLGDLRGPHDELLDFLKSYISWCHQNAWTVAFLQTGESQLEVYKAATLSALKVGEDAVVDLDRFASSTIKKKDFKNCVKKLEKEGFSFQLSKAPQSDKFLDDLEAVSNEWLSLPGRRERSFSLGVFDRQTLKEDNIFSVRDKDGSLVAFVNQVRSYAEKEASIDLMRHRHDVPNGTMDYLFVKLLLEFHAEGFKRFNLGLAALSGVGDDPEANLYEKACKQIFEHMNRFFSYKGLRNYKNKFDPEWQSRYLIYEGGTPGLLKTALAILEVGETVDTD